MTELGKITATSRMQDHNTHNTQEDSTTHRQSTINQNAMKTSMFESEEFNKAAATTGPIPAGIHQKADLKDKANKTAMMFDIKSQNM